jgi:hypothetical protein
LLEETATMTIRFAVDLDDPPGLVDVIDGLRGAQGSTRLTLFPTVPPTVESRGVFGRRRSKLAPWHTVVFDRCDLQRPPEWVLYLRLPDGPPVAQRHVAPPRVGVVERDARNEFGVLMSGAMAGSVAAEVCRFTRELIGPYVQGGWSGEIAAISDPFYRPQQPDTPA